MTTRRWIALALVALAIFTIAPPSSRAQIPMIANGIIHATVASVNAANTTNEILLYQYPIPGALLASWTSTNAAFGSAPLHLVLNGTVLSTGAGAGSLGVNLGSSALATISLSNAGYFTPAAAGPYRLEVTISPVATVTTQNCVDLKPCNISVYMQARVESSFNNASGTIAQSAITLGTIAINQPLTLNVNHRWSAAASGNSLNIYNGVLKLGF